MDNSHSRWRISAKLVAYIDFLILSLDMIVCIIFGLLLLTGAIGYIDLIDFYGWKIGGHFTPTVTIIWIIFGIGILMAGVQTWATLKLLNASENVTNVNQAVGNARISRNVNIVFLVLGLISCIAPPYWPYLLIVAWRGFVIFIVYKYINELEGLIMAGSNDYC